MKCLIPPSIGEQSGQVRRDEGAGKARKKSEKPFNMVFHKKT